MKKEQLNNLSGVCPIQLGFTSRSRLEESEQEGVRCIQQGDLNKGEDLDFGTIKRFQLEGNIDRFKVSGGEVLFRSRAGQAVAEAVPEGLREPCVVINPVMILRPKSEVLLPGYLAWALNQPWVQAQLSRDVRGTAVKMIPKSALERVRIPLPSKDVQKRLVDFDRLIARESALLEALLDRRARWAEAIAGQLLNVDRIPKGAMQ